MTTIIQIWFHDLEINSFKIQPMWPLIFYASMVHWFKIDVAKSASGKKMLLESSKWNETSLILHQIHCPMHSARSCTQDSFKGNYFQFSEVLKIPGSSLNDSVTKWNLLLQLQNWKMWLDCSIVNMPKTELRQRLLALESDATTDASVNTSCFSTIWTTRLPNLTYLPFPSNHCLLMFQLHYPEKTRGKW